jgi:RNA polymerase sigma factor (sigma-70 family)
MDWKVRNRVMDKLEDLLKSKDLLNLKRKIACKFSRLDIDDIESAYAVSVWRARERFIPSFNTKFTTFFYLIFNKECLNLCRKLKLTQQLDNEVLIEDTHMFEFEHFMYRLPEEGRKLLTQRYLERKTLREIGDENGYSYEIARKKIKKYIKSLTEE